MWKRWGRRLGCTRTSGKGSLGELSKIPTPPRLLYTTATSRLPKCNWIIWKSIILIPLGVLERHTTTTSHLLTCIRVTRGIIKTKSFNSFLEGFFVIEGQPHLNPH